MSLTEPLEQPASLNTWSQLPIESCTTWMRDEFPHKIHIIPAGKITLQRTGLSLSIQGRKAFSWINYFLHPNILWSSQSKFKTSIHLNLLLSSLVLKGYLDLSLLAICTKVNKNSFSLSKTNFCSILTTG